MSHVLFWENSKGILGFPRKCTWGKGERNASSGQGRGCLYVGLSLSLSMGIHVQLERSVLASATFSFIVEFRSLRWNSLHSLSLSLTLSFFTKSGGRKKEDRENDRDPRCKGRAISRPRLSCSFPADIKDRSA